MGMVSKVGSESTFIEQLKIGNKLEGHSLRCNTLFLSPPEHLDLTVVPDAFPELPWAVSSRSYKEYAVEGRSA